MQLNKELNKENIDINKFTEYSQSSIKSILDKAIEKHKQIILTGAPGTGKTYNVRSYVNDQIEPNEKRSEFVQFHPSYDYSDFIEGLRPVILDEATIEEPTFVKMDGIFKAFCRKVVSENYDKIKAKNPTEVNLPFSDLYKKYEDNCTDKYFFIIDEINRADLSKVFGELMFGLEKSYRGIENSFQTQYKNLKTYEILTNGKGKIIDFDCFSKGFFIPKNLYIIGTMNDIDKSVESFDFALRRRFKWIEIKANEVAHISLTEILNNSSPEQINTLVDKIKKMNNVISDSVEGRKLGLSEAYHIGHAYFKKVDLNNPLSLKNIFNKNIVPILKEYTRGRQQSDINDFIAKCAEALEVEYEK
ncbi:McrB family protein [Mycoplasmopsis cynos]|nr:AAA family ATPase [Mycoplasmopsis cynos]TQC55014.1 hypothetical protein E1I74_00355 [Mycoplasmopsis cynos]